MQVPWKMENVFNVSFLHLDVPQLEHFASEPGVREAFCRLMETQSGKDYLVFIKCSNMY